MRSTLEVFAAHEAGVDVLVGEGDGAQLLEIKVQDCSGKQKREGALSVFLPSHAIMPSYTG